jgi:two-component sensor histidine kinase
MLKISRTDLDGAIVESIPQPILVLDDALNVQFANSAFLRQFRVTAAETLEHYIFELGNGQWDLPGLRELLEDVLPREKSFDEYEVERNFKNIGRRTMRLNARRLDRLNLILLLVSDVTRQRSREFRQNAVIRELQHRVRNLIASVRGLVLQTRRNSRTINEFFDAFEARLGALARTQDLLTSTPSERISLREIIILELVAVGAEEDRQFTMAGPDVGLHRRNAQALAMAIHELTTNALKHGALGSDNGRIEINWEISRSENPGTLTFRWEERGVHIPNRNIEKGFGLTMIERKLPYMLGGAAELKFKPDGLLCTLTFPLA